MAIRIVHTADNHLGLPFRSCDDATRAALTDERFAALDRLIETANQRQADFFVVAGDLFDSTRVKTADVERAASILAGFAGTAVLVLPGNHDFCSGPDTEVWKRFRKATASTDTIELLDQPTVVRYDVNGQPIEFFPCPCPSKTGREPATGWVYEADHDPTALRIGIAHGNVDGLGLDAADRYFTMAAADLEKASLATWLLGHIHVPFPASDRGTHSPFFMAGIHTPDSVRCRHAGSAWLLECSGTQLNRYERLSPGKIRFIRLTETLSSTVDIDRLEAACLALEAATTVLDLQLTGRLNAADRQKLETVLTRLRPLFLSLTVELDLHEQIDRERIAATYASGGLAERLLSRLVDDKNHPDAVTLAHDLIQEVTGR